MKPILFNTDEVCSTLDGRKTVKRIPVKPTSLWEESLVSQVGNPGYWGNWDDEKIYKAPYRPGDILYVQETWAQRKCADCQDDECGPDIMRKWSLVPCYDGIFLYKATDFINRPIKWHPSIHMPKEAARLFLRVTDVRVERLQDIDFEGCKAEGIWDDYKTYSEKYHENLARMAYLRCFSELWDSTIKKADLPLYSWAANPWVWVIEFERISKEAAVKGSAE